LRWVRGDLRVGRICSVGVLVLRGNVTLVVLRIKLLLGCSAIAHIGIVGIAIVDRVVPHGICLAK